MKETSLKAGKFTIYVEKATEFSPGLRFSVGCSRIVSQVCQIQKLDWVLAISKDDVMMSYYFLLFFELESLVKC